MMAGARAALGACALVLGLVLGLAFASPFPAVGQTPTQPLANTVFGLWHTEDGAALVEITRCERSLCGTIIAVEREADGKTILLDARNRDAALRQRRVKGLMILSGFRPEGDRWIGGMVYSPERGRAFSSKVSLLKNGALKVEGCLAQICQAQIWHRAAAPS